MCPTTLPPMPDFELIKGPYTADQSFTNSAVWSAKRWSNTSPVTASDSVVVTVAEPAKPATVTVAHFAPFAASVDGTSVSVFVNGAEVFQNFKFGDVQKNVELPAGDYHIEIVPTGSSSVAISGDFTLEAGVDYTLAAIGDGANQSLELLPFVDDNVAGRFRRQGAHRPPLALRRRHRRHQGRPLHRRRRGRRRRPALQGCHQPRPARRRL